MMLFIGVVNDGDNEDHDADNEGHDGDNDDHDGEGNGDDIEYEEAEERNLSNWVLSLCSFHHTFKHLLNLGRKKVRGHQSKHIIDFL